ncbi:unnamed protein product [Linum tenue]|uniref:Uncharacterized protein n=1 Tax=Linum tenue TaxID=586396 RepID=A0AAV0M6W5_9ROSI|nr:unnamed protein product [Linum tenue]
MDQAASQRSFFSDSSLFLSACLKPRTMNMFVKVRSDSAPPCSQSTLDKEVPYCTFADSNEASIVYQDQFATRNHKQAIELN